MELGSNHSDPRPRFWYVIIFSDAFPGWVTAVTAVTAISKESHDHVQNRH